MQELVSIQVINKLKGLGVVVVQPVPVGSIVVSARVAAVCIERTNLSIETASGQHILMDEPAIRINHSCQPTVQPTANAHGGYDFVALRAIEPGEEITFDYGETETNVVQSFPCDCQSPACRKIVTGKRGAGPTAIEDVVDAV